MDMDVDSAVLRQLASALVSCNNKMKNASSTMCSNVQSAGSSLEGRQYDLSKEASGVACEAVNASAENLNKLSKHLEQLATDVEAYCACKYSGG